MNKPVHRIEKLIAELCPEGVGLKSIGEICQINRGRVMSKDYLRNNAGEYPVYSSQTADDGVFGRINTYDYDGEYLTWTTDGANAGSIFYRNGKFSITNVCGLLRIKVDGVDTKFLAYILATVSKKYVSAGMGNPKIMSNVMEKIKIPIPPLTIQQEIVKILDTFTTLEAELEAELEARKKQYEYYRDELLMFGEGVEWKTLGEVTHYPKNRISFDKVNNTSYVGVDNLLQNKQGKTESSYVPIAGNLIEYKINDVLIGNIRPYLKKIWLSTNNGGTNGDVVVIRINGENKKRLNPRYLYFLLSSDKFFDYDMQFAKGAKMPRGNKDVILKYKIPIPALVEQERIVAILDKFDALVNDISAGLPAELNARRKQYEYYQNRLLTFKPLESEYAKQ
ncbi:MAG: restriction endonuclease subunit S [Syntrophaceae bacterium]|nr:restriction endonuclease subunit S [Syntrophaceae bacterium]